MPTCHSCLLDSSWFQSGHDHSLGFELSALGRLVFIQNPVVTYYTPQNLDMVMRVTEQKNEGTFSHLVFGSLAVQQLMRLFWKVQSCGEKVCHIFVCYVFTNGGLCS